MTRISAIREACLARLKDAFKKEGESTYLDVHNFPGNPSSFQPRHPKGHCLIRYAGSNYGKTKDVGSTVQDRKPKYEIILLIRDIRETAEAEPYIETAINAVIGYKHPACSKIEIVSDGFVSEKNSMWQYSIVFTTQTMKAEPDPEDITAPFKTYEAKRGEIT